MMPVVNKLMEDHLRRYNSDPDYRRRCDENMRLYWPGLTAFRVNPKIACVHTAILGNIPPLCSGER